MIFLTPHSRVEEGLVPGYGQTANLFEVWIIFHGKGKWQEMTKTIHFWLEYGSSISNGFLGSLFVPRTDRPTSQFHVPR